MTTRGLNESDFITVAGFIHRGVEIAITANKQIAGINYHSEYI